MPVSLFVRWAHIVHDSCDFQVPLKRDIEQKSDEAQLSETFRGIFDVAYHMILHNSHWSHSIIIAHHL